MPSVFTRIIQGELPAHFVWQDELCVGFLSIAPLRPGHTLVVPRAEVDHWLDLEPELMRHLAGVSQQIGQGIQEAFRPVRVGSLILGLEVPHVHIHVSPIWRPTDLDFAQADHKARPADLATAATRLRTALRGLGFAGVAGTE